MTLDSRGFQQQPDSGLDSYLINLNQKNMGGEIPSKTENMTKAMFALSPKHSVRNSTEEDLIRDSS